VKYNYFAPTTSCTFTNNQQIIIYLFIYLLQTSYTKHKIQNIMHTTNAEGEIII